MYDPLRRLRSGAAAVRRGPLAGASAGRLVEPPGAGGLRFGLSFAASNLGEVVHTTSADAAPATQIFSTTRGTIATSTSNVLSPAIHDSGEVVWIEGDTNPVAVHSSTRGVLSSEEDVISLVINNGGDVAWIGYVGGTCSPGGCTGGALQATVYKCGTVNRIDPSLNPFPSLAMNDEGALVFGRGQGV